MGLPVKWRRTYKLGAAFSVGLWNINSGGGRFFAPTRSELSIAEKLALLKGAGITHIEAHDSDIAAIGAKEFAKLLAEEGLSWGMYTPNLFSGSPLYATGALDSPIATTRQEAIEAFKKVIAEAVEYNVDLVVFWNGMAGYNMPFEKDHVLHLRYLQDAFEELVEWEIENFGGRARYIAIEPKPNEPRNYMYLGTVGDAMAFIASLPSEIQPYLGVNPETAHSLMAGLDHCQDIAAALLYGKLFHIHLNDQNGPRYDQDYAFGDVSPLKALETISLLADNGYSYLVGFDVQPLPSDREDQQAASVERSIETFRTMLAIWEEEVDRNQLAELQGTSDAHEIMRYIRDFV